MKIQFAILVLRRTTKNSELWNSIASSLFMHLPRGTGDSLQQCGWCIMHSKLDGHGFFEELGNKCFETLETHVFLLSVRIRPSSYISASIHSSGEKMVVDFVPEALASIHCLRIFCTVCWGFFEVRMTAMFVFFILECRYCIPQTLRKMVLAILY